MSKKRTLFALLTGATISGGIYCHLSGMQITYPVIPPTDKITGEEKQIENEKDEEIKRLNTILWSAKEQWDEAVLNWNSEKIELTTKINEHKKKIKNLNEKINNQTNEINNQKNNLKELDSEINNKKEEIATLNNELNKSLKALFEATKNYLTADKRSKVIFSAIINKRCPDGEGDINSSSCPKIKSLRTKLGNIEEPTETEIKKEMDKIIEDAQSN